MKRMTTTSQEYFARIKAKHKLFMKDVDKFVPLYADKLKMVLFFTSSYYLRSNDIHIDTI